MDGEALTSQFDVFCVNKNLRTKRMKGFRFAFHHDAELVLEMLGACDRCAAGKESAEEAGEQVLHSVVFIVSVDYLSK